MSPSTRGERDLPDTLPIHGQPVPIGDYEVLRRLEHMAFGLTPSDMPEARAHRLAIRAAIAGLNAMRGVVRHAQHKR